MFNTPHNYKKVSEPEKNSGISLTEKAGYIPAKKRIEDMIFAGQRLSDYRKSQFDLMMITSTRIIKTLLEDQISIWRMLFSLNNLP